MRMWALWGGVVAVSCLVGCDKLAEKVVQKAQQQAQQAQQAQAQAQAQAQGQPAAEEVDKDGQLAEKLSKYITCLNGATPQVFRSKSRYLDWLKDEKVGPTGKERNVYGPLELSQSDFCLKELAEAKTMEPKLPEVEAAADAYSAQLTSMVPLVKDAADYYEQKDYTDDKFAKAKEMHPKLMAAFDAFEKVNEAFETKVVAENEAVGKRQLAKIAKDPDRKLEYKARVTVDQAKALVKAAEVRTLDELNQETFDAALKAFGDAVSDLDAYATQNKEQTDKVSMFSELTDNAKALQLAAKELSRRKRDKKDFNKEFFSGNNPEMVDGHPAQVIAKFNDVIQASNRLRYDRLYEFLAKAKAGKTG